MDYAFCILLRDTPLKFKMEPEDLLLEKDIPISETQHFQVPAVRFQGGLADLPGGVHHSQIFNLNYLYERKTLQV